MLHEVFIDGRHLKTQLFPSCVCACVRACVLLCLLADFVLVCVRACVRACVLVCVCVCASMYAKEAERRKSSGVFFLGGRYLLTRV